jgi:hypothetical protein
MSKILDAEDILADAQGCIECVFMAASKLTSEGRNPIHTVADIASKKIDEAIALLHEYRESGDLPVLAAPGAKPKSSAARPKRRNK